MRSFAISVTAIGLMLFPLVNEAAIGKAEFVVGEVQAINTAGTPRNINKGDEINQGDTIVTKNSGRIQVRFSDNGYISLQPDSRFRIDEYRFNNEADTSNKGFFSLLKGGLRAITGAITRKNKNAYQVNTAVATIGIRGTHFTARLCAQDCVAGGKRIQDGLYANVTRGAIFMANSGGSLDLQPGQTGQVRGINTRPSRIERMPIGFAPQRGERRQQTSQQSGRDTQTVSSPSATTSTETSSSTSTTSPEKNSSPALATESALITTIPSTLTTTLPPREGDTFLNGDGALGGRIISPVLAGVATDVDNAPSFPAGKLVNAGGATAAIVNASNEVVAVLEGSSVHSLGTARVMDSNFESTTGLFWGRWTGGTITGSPELTFVPEQSVHYIFGPPATNFPTTGSATYNLIGGTRSTDNQGGIGLGATTMSNISINFSTQMLNVTLKVDHSGLYILSSSSPIAMGPNFTFRYNTSSTSGPVGMCSSTGCFSQVEGFFSGTEGRGAGLVYEIQALPTSLHIHGAAAFRR